MPSSSPTVLHDLLRVLRVSPADLLSPARGLNNPRPIRIPPMWPTRFQRYPIAVTLASSLLQFYNSPWINETWSKEDIHFLKAVEGSSLPVIVDKPYISHNFTSYLQPSANHALDTIVCNASTKCIRALGIMLLELCLGQAVEDQPIRKNYFGLDRQPNDVTDYCTAERWLEDVDGESRPRVSSCH
ncbi:hypothetical protein ABVK25_011962 [Lepraria finkii]|uniref:DUF7580 domain-containing protein n=1 Tax=Lepraria finkii TaxID=1340010 RepID=A0ABR4AR14_9LECA